MNLNIGEAITSLLTSNVNLKAKVNDRIFPIASKLNTTFPFVVYHRDSIEPQYTKDYYTSELITESIAIASDKYASAVEIADLVRDSLEGKKGTYAGITIKSIRLEGADEEYIEDTYIQNLTFKIKI